MHSREATPSLTADELGRNSYVTFGWIWWYCLYSDLLLYTLYRQLTNLLV